MNWTTSADIKKQVHKLWDRGRLLSSLIESETLFPCRLTLKVPASSELSDDFAAVREWIDGLRNGEGKGYRITWKEINHRVLGRNSVPQEIWIDSLEDALVLINKKNDARIFTKILDETGHRFPVLLRWLVRHPMRALELTDAWPHLLDVIAWIQNHPLSGVYLRQIDVPGLHTKFIERHRGVLSELLDLVLPPEAIRADATGSAAFCRRYGFRDKPQRIRFRILDPEQAILPSKDQDIAITGEAFAWLNLQKRIVFITENETNFLAFPQAKHSLVIFGAGYGFEGLSAAHWLQDCRIYYWGDIDTHGFAILDQLRADFPHAQSLLMDRDTLLSHRQQWVTETEPEIRDLPRLTELESRIYDDLRYNHFGVNVRLEQEVIGFSAIELALNRLGCTIKSS